MTLRELIQSVDSEQYSDSPLFQKLRETKPEYCSNRRIQVKLIDCEIAVTNVHVGSLGDIITPAYASPLSRVFKCSRCKVRHFPADLQRINSKTIGVKS